MSFDVAQDGNLFPREDLLEAVAQSDWRDRRVSPAAWILLSLGALAVAAGLPIADRVIAEPSRASAEGVATWLHPLHALAGSIGRAGLGIEAAWFLISALALGGSLLALRLALTSFGLGGRLALVATLCALGAPLVANSGRLPSDFTAGVFGSSLLLAAAPAVLTCAAQRGAASRVNALLPTLVVIAMAVAAHLGGHGLLAGTAGVDSGRAVGLLLAGGSLWLFAPLAWRRSSEEDPPPRWLAVWLIGGVIWTLAGGLLGSRAACSALVPALCVLFAAVLARRARPDSAARDALLAAVGQGAALVLAALLTPTVHSEFTRTRGELRPDDVVVAAPGARAPIVHLLRRRHGLAVIDAASRPAIDSARAAGKRLVALGGPIPGLPRFVSVETGAVSTSTEGAR